MTKPIYQPDFSRYIKEFETRLSNIEAATYDDSLNSVKFIVKKNANQSIPALTNTKLTWDTIVTDSTSTFSSGGNYFTVPKDGTYIIATSIMWNNLSSTGPDLQMFISIDNAEYVAMAKQSYIAGMSSYPILNTTAVLDLDKNQTISIEVYQNTSGAQNIGTVSSIYIPRLSIFSI